MTICFYSCAKYPACRLHPCGAILFINCELFLWPLWFCHTSFKNSVNGKIFGKRDVFDKKCVFFLQLSCGELCCFVKSPINKSLLNINDVFIQFSPVYCYLQYLMRSTNYETRHYVALVKSPCHYR